MQNINFQYYHNDCNKHSKDCLGPTAIKVSGKDLTGANLQTGIFMNYCKLTIIRQR